MADVSGLSVPEVLQQLVGRGAADDPGRRRGDPLRPGEEEDQPPEGTSCDDWLDGDARGAQARLQDSTATMMYGHLETDEDIVEHLDASGSCRTRPRVHGVHAVELQAGEHAAGEDHPALRHADAVPPDARALADLPRQLRPHPGVVVLGGEEDGADRAPLRRGRFRRDAASRRTCTRRRTSSTRPTPKSSWTSSTSRGSSPRSGTRSITFCECTTPRRLRNVTPA